MDYDAFDDKDLFWSKKGLEYGDWEAGPNKDGSFTLAGTVQASEVRQEQFFSPIVQEYPVLELRNFSISAYC